VAIEATTRNNLLYWGTCRLAERGYPKEACRELFKAAQIAGLPDREITKTIRSANNRLGGVL
jgi:Primase C terminal 1 (PriCT-1)